MRKFAWVTLGLFSLPLLAAVPSVEDQVANLEMRVSRLEKRQPPTVKFDGVIPEEAVRYNPASECKKITQFSKHSSFNAAVEFMKLKEVACSDATYVVVRANFVSAAYPYGIDIIAMFKKDELLFN